MVIILVVSRQAAHIEYSVLGYTAPQSLNVINSSIPPSTHPPISIHVCFSRVESQWQQAPKGILMVPLATFLGTGRMHLKKLECHGKALIFCNL